MQILFRNTPARVLATLAMAVAAVSTVRAAVDLKATLAVRPVTRGDIAAYKLPSTTQVSNGLTTVGVGQPLYLEVQVSKDIAPSEIADVAWQVTWKPIASKVALTDSPLVSAVPVYEPSDRLVAQVAGRKLLRPDVVGAYTVNATIHTTDGQTVNLARTFFGANYVGAETCAQCHGGGLAQDKSPSWAKTAHASLFKEGINGVASDHYTASCIGCHVAGNDVDPAAVNGGFDDVAKKLNWTFPAKTVPGNFESMPHELQNLASIQCENCHGPGSMHIAGVSTISISVNLGSGDCAVCHDAPTHHIKNGEWNNSKHAIATRDASGPGEAACVGCHTGVGFIGKAKGLKTISTDYTAINCQACHEPHGQTAPDGAAHIVRTVADVTLADGTKVVDGGTGKLCMNCHMSRRNAKTYAETTAGSARFGPHHGPQSDMLQGTNAYTYGKDIPSSAHSFIVEDTCVTCHMQTVAETDAAFTHAGGHTFKPSWDGGTTGTAVNLVGACQKCHGPDLTGFDFKLFDYDGDGTIDGVQTEVQHLLDRLSAMLPPDNKAKTALVIDSTWTRPQLEAAYNWLYVTEDGSRGIHNTAYTVGVLKAAIANLEAEKK